jgi:transposase InsO family protein
MHASKPNELLHWDFLAMTDGYLLVIKDDASKYLLLWETMTVDDHSVARPLLHWFSLFGVPYCWLTDQGSHFKNTVIADLQHQLGAKHHFTTARCPWANGTVENTMKQVLPRCFKNADIPSLNCGYYANKKAWMIS